MASRHLLLSLRSYSGEERLHAHEHHQLVLSLCGRLEMRVGAAAGTVGATGAALVAGGMPHAFRAEGDNCFLVLDMPGGGGLPERVLAEAAASPFFALDDRLIGFARYLAGEMAEGALDAEAGRHATALLAGAIGRRIAPAAGPSPPIARAMALARIRFAGRLTVAALARAAAMGPSRFHERFRQEIGVTPAQYIADLRLDHAAALLRSGRMPIAEIALAAGFSDQSALTRCLRRRRGVTPAALRRQA